MYWTSMVFQSVGSPGQANRTRTITFGATTDLLRRLQSMTEGGRTWSYTQVASLEVGHSLLTAVAPPVGAGWGFTYNTATPPRYELKKLTTPQGGEISYDYDDQLWSTRIAAGGDSGPSGPPDRPGTFARPRRGSALSRRRRAAGRPPRPVVPTRVTSRLRHLVCLAAAPPAVVLLSEHLPAQCFSSGRGCSRIVR